MKIYISGKIGTLPKNIYTGLFAEGKEEAFKELGATEVINPVELPHHHNQTWESFMLEDIKALFDCDAIYMLRNWKESKGARIEHSIAIEMSKQVYYQ